MSQVIENPTTSASVQSWIDAVTAQARAEGHVAGFMAGVTYDWSSADKQAASMLNGLLSQVENLLKQNFHTSALVRYHCGTKNSCVKVAITIPENIYIAKYVELYSFLSGIELAIPKIWPQLSKFIIDSMVITFSDSIPVDMDALGRDYPYTAQTP